MSAALDGSTTGQSPKEKRAFTNQPCSLKANTRVTHTIWKVAFYSLYAWLNGLASSFIVHVARSSGAERAKAIPSLGIQAGKFASNAKAPAASTPPATFAGQSEKHCGAENSLPPPVTRVVHYPAPSNVDVEPETTVRAELCATLSLH
eukprot:3935261-Pleurochrysis_carterae.AAC.2